MQKKSGQQPNSKTHIHHSHQFRAGGRGREPLRKLYPHMFVMLLDLRMFYLLENPQLHRSPPKWIKAKAALCHLRNRTNKIHVARGPKVRRPKHFVESCPCCTLSVAASTYNMRSHMSLCVHHIMSCNKMRTFPYVLRSYIL